MAIHELKPCPFCGATITSYSGELEKNGFVSLSIHCQHCNTRFELQPIVYHATVMSNPNERLVFPFGDALSLWNGRWNEKIEVEDADGREEM